MLYSDERIIEYILNDTNNPGSCVKDPCGICKKKVKSEHQAVLCDSCELWVHISCNKMSLREYENLKYNSDLWHCQACNILFAGSALDSFQCLRSLLIVSFHVFFGLPRPRCPTTSNSVMLLIQPAFLTTCPNQRSRLYRNKVCMLLIPNFLRRV